MITQHIFNSGNNQRVDVCTAKYHTTSWPTFGLKCCAQLLIPWHSSQQLLDGWLGACSLKSSKL